MDEKQRAEHDSKVLWNQHIVYAIVAELPLMQSRGKKITFLHGRRALVYHQIEQKKAQSVSVVNNI